MCRHIIIFILFLLPYLSSNAEANFHVNVAIVDVQLILEHAKAVQSIRKSIFAISENINKELLQKEAELKKIEDKILRKKETLTKDEFDREVIEFNKNVSDIKRNLQSKKLRLEQAHVEAIQKVHEKTIEIISKLSKKHKVNLVLPKSQTLFADDTLNITEEVLELLNKELDTLKVNYHWKRNISHDK